MKNKYLNFIIGTLFFPTIILAESTFASLATIVVMLINRLSILVMGLALLFFAIGIVRFISTSGDDKSREQGKQLMVWGIIALASMVAVWGLVNIITATFLGCALGSC